MIWLLKVCRAVALRFEMPLLICTVVLVKVKAFALVENRSHAIQFWPDTLIVVLAVRFVKITVEPAPGFPSGFQLPLVLHTLSAPPPSQLLCPHAGAKEKVNHKDTKTQRKDGVRPCP